MPKNGKAVGVGKKIKLRVESVKDVFEYSSISLFFIPLTLCIPLFASCDVRLKYHTVFLYSDITCQKSDRVSNTHPEQTWMTFHCTFVYGIKKYHVIATCNMMHLT